MHNLIKTILCIGSLAAFFSGNFSLQGASVLSYRYDSSSSGVNPSETVLTPSNLTVGTFSKLYATAVDGQIYTQPLYVPNVAVTGGAQAGTHNLVIVGTEHDSLYAIDAISGVIVWQTSFLTTGLAGATTITPEPAADSGSTNTTPWIGITGTPVIDGMTNLLYVAAKTKQILNGVTTSPNYVYTLYKIDITNGNATPNANIVSSTIIGDTIYSNSTYTFRTNTSPTAAQDPFVFGTGDGVITVNSQSRVYFNALRELNRTALLLYNGTVYVCFAAPGDVSPYHGWMLGYYNTLAVNAVCNLTPNGGLGGIWQSGGCPVVDSSGNIYVMTGNGTFDGNNAGGTVTGLNAQNMPVNGDYGDSFVKLAVDSTTSPGNQNINGWGLKVVDYFAPFNNQTLSDGDTDLGSGGCTLLPTTAGSTTHPQLLVGAGKQGNIYLVDCASMGKYSTTDNVVQSQVAINGCFDTPAFFNGVLYYVATLDNGKAFSIANAVMSTTPVKTTDTFGYPGSGISVSANGTTNGLVWTLERDTAVLRAYAASNLGTEIWNSSLAPNYRDQLDSVTKFAVPAVADGRVMVGTSTALTAYGLTPAAAAPPSAAPTSLTATSVSALEVDLKWTDNSNNETGFAIEQSSDGVHFTQIGATGPNATVYAATDNLQAQTLYYFRVRAFNNYQGFSYSAYTNTASATTTAQAATLSFPSGFAGSTSLLQYNGDATIVDTNQAQLTNGTSNVAGTVWSQTVQNIQRFSTQFTFQLTNPVSDGITFTIQNNNPSMVGIGGGGLAYAGINLSCAIKFDLYSNEGEGPDSTGLYVNGAYPSIPATDLTGSGVNLHSGDIMSVSLTYDGTTLTEKITDTITAATKTLTYPIDIPTTIGSNTAYVGFTGATGGGTADQNVLTWTFATTASGTPPAPTNLTATAASTTQINLSWTNNATDESGFIIQRAPSATGTFTPIGIAAGGQSNYQDSGLSPGTTYFYRVYATDNTGNSSFTNASATTLGNTYSSWVIQEGLTGANALQTAIVSSDRLTNLFKYATGLNPFVTYSPGNPALPMVQVKNFSGTNYLTLTFTGVATDVTYTVQASSDLTGAWSIIYTSTPGVAPGTITVQDTQPIPTSSPTKRFMRLQVSPSD